MERPPFLKLSEIRKVFEGAIAVDQFELEVAAGELVSVLGPSGCGKSTTLRIIAGLEQPTAGRVYLAGREITDYPANRRGVGMVFQSYALFPNMSVHDNIGFGLRVRGRSASSMRRRVDELLGLIHLADKRNRYPHQLSGGEQQRVALARALAIEPDVLLLDEPLSALDAQIRLELRGEIRRIQRELNLTTIYVTHDQEEALSISDRVVVMRAGRIEQVGTPFEVYNYPRSVFIASFVGTLNWIPGRVVDPRAGTVLIGARHIQTGGPLNQPPGEQVVVTIRPESLSLDGAAGDGWNRLSGDIQDVAFLGSIIRAKVRLIDSDSILWVDTFNNPRIAVPEVGDSATIVFSPDAVLVHASAAHP